MPKKIADLEEDTKDKVHRTVDATATQLGGDTYEGNVPSKISGYGLCSKCKHLQYCASEFGVKVAKCYEFEMPLTDAEPVTDCTQFIEKGRMTLFEMLQIAWDVGSEDKKVAGFARKEKDG